METTISRSRGFGLSLGVMLVMLLVCGAARGQRLAAQQPLAHRAPTFFGAIQVNEPDHDLWTRTLRAAGLDSVQVTLYARQQDWDGAELWYDRDAPWVVSEIRAAHRAGLKVMLVLRVALEQGLARNRHLWHGMIWPRQELVDDWFRNYAGFVRWGTRIAATEGVELLAIGNELTSLTSTRTLQKIPDLYAYWGDPQRVARVQKALVACAEQVRRDGGGADLVQLDGGRYATLQDMLQARAAARAQWVHVVTSGGLAAVNARRALYQQHWLDIIRNVRESYAGKVTYGANFDQYGDVGFWEALDYVGINAYFPLGLYGEASAARVERMESSWRRVSQQIAAAVPTMPVLFLEMGWTRWRGATVRPYSYDRVEVLETADSNNLTCVHWASQPQDPSERVAAIQALDNVIAAGDFPALRGFTLWKATTRRSHRAIEPFAVLVDPQHRYDRSSWQTLAPSQVDLLDSAYVGIAADIAARVAAPQPNSTPGSLQPRQ